MQEITSAYNKNYLSKRPFLIVSNMFRPPAGAKTANKGWADQTGWDRLESITIVDRVKQTHIANAVAIIDILEIKAVKNSFDHEDQEVIRYFLVKYEKELKEALRIWANKEAVRVAKLKEFSASVENAGGAESPVTE